MGAFFFTGFWVGGATRAARPFRATRCGLAAHHAHLHPIILRVNTHAHLAFSYAGRPAGCKPSCLCFSRHAHLASERSGAVRLRHRDAPGRLKISAFFPETAGCRTALRVSRLRTNKDSCENQRQIQNPRLLSPDRPVVYRSSGEATGVPGWA
ncbi:hypothetical protein E2562_028534 [Oryza meyeriana var. granulata]|uniref:Uncharacterized protein n=1 Tax=Oryza meyeriana var. granulata TaxID=110450 RepID=A0A6G1EQL9_9ORYZ|nr:hypothetical protein E2562_028534 [Oryza meyeriana var. granulata]